MPATNAGTRVNSVSPEEVAEMQEGCQATLECAIQDTVATVLLALVFVVGVLVPVAVLAFVHLRDALRVVREERKEANGEANAYAAFVRRVARMEPDPASPPTVGNGTATGMATNGGLVHGGGGAGLDPVIDAYRETVMADAGRGSASDRAVVEDMAAEFGEEVAGIVHRSDRLTPELRAALVQNGKQSATRREDLVGAVDREIEDLTDARAVFEEIAGRAESETEGHLEQRPYDELLDSWRTLGALERRCGSHLEDRQARIHTAPFNDTRTDPDEPPALQSYLYDPLDVTFPVLAEGTKLARRLRKARSQLASAIATR